MADGTTIEWTDATWNPITGCSVVSPGCTNCYAMRLAGTRLKHHPSRAGLTQDTKAGPVWTGEVRFNPQWLDQPLRWKRPRKIFVCAHGDLFADGVEDAWLDQIFAVMALAPQHVFQVLTKRPERAREYLNGTPSTIPILGRMPLERIHLEAAAHMDGDGGFMDTLKEHGNIYSLYCSVPWPLPNVWLGVSVEDQRRAEERIPVLLDTPAAVRWISAEPLLGPVNLTEIEAGDGVMDAVAGNSWEELKEIWRDSSDTWQDDFSDWYEVDFDRATGPAHPTLDWVVAGGESGPSARPMHPDWARSLRDQCAAADVPFHFKQWGEYWPTYDRDSDDPDWRRCDLAERQTPHGRWLNIAGGHGFHGNGVVRVARIGKTRAGRLLDGVEHNGFPEVPHG